MKTEPRKIRSNTLKTLTRQGRATDTTPTKWVNEDSLYALEIMRAVSEHSEFPDDRESAHGVMDRICFGTVCRDDEYFLSLCVDLYEEQP